MTSEIPSCNNAMRQIDRIQQQLDQISDTVAAEVAAGLVAHEIRNLLTPAVAYSQLALRETDQSPATRRVLEQSVCAMRRACEVAELILACYRPPTSQDADQHCNVAAVVHDCINSLAWDAQSCATLEVRVPDHLFAAIRSESLRHVVLNLLLNAKAALPLEGGTLLISADKAPRSTWNERFVLTITDNGKGMTPSALTQIRASLAATSLSRGSHPGLGLLLCQRLLRTCDGALTIDSQKDAGTTVAISLPTATKAVSLAA